MTFCVMRCIIIMQSIGRRYADEISRRDDSVPSKA